MIRTLIFVALAGRLLAAEPQLTSRSGTASPPKDLQPAVSELIETRSVVVSDKSGAICSFWLRKEIPLLATKDSPTYRSVKPGTLIGVVQLHRDWRDFKTHEVPTGVYTLRLAVQPETKDHEGTAPLRDFVILVPAKEDTKPDVLPLKAIIQKSGVATGGTHPVVMLLFPFEKPEVIVKGKRIVVGVPTTQKFGFAFTLIGSGVD
jgi:hypothetical protein